MCFTLISTLFFLFGGTRGSAGIVVFRCSYHRMIVFRVGETCIVCRGCDSVIKVCFRTRFPKMN
jgi:hypothetical protein